MVHLRKAEARGHFDHGWLNTYHTFSFGKYSDPAHMGFRALRVLNDDRVAPGKGFGAHGHRDMEIFTYVLEGGLAHNDSMGERHVLRPNEIQAMSAGTGVIHSEFNASNTDPVHLLQIWILPAVEDVPPSYRQFAYDPSEKRNRLRLLVGPDTNPSEPAAFIHQDARAYACVLDPGKTIEQPIAPGRHAWVHCAQGNMMLNGHAMKQGDGAALSDERAIQIATNGGHGEFLVIDLA
ncbi:MAG: pirin family protein [Bryobacterales bacterium]|nr:pirin family protein [Bryobacterales bacterium]MBV9399932.1 pirin family protein [Bryobacterales bacterium]